MFVKALAKEMKEMAEADNSTIELFHVNEVIPVWNPYLQTISSFDAAMYVVWLAWSSLLFFKVILKRFRA